MLKELAEIETLTRQLVKDAGELSNFAYPLTRMEYANGQVSVDSDCKRCGENCKCDEDYRDTLEY